MAESGTLIYSPGISIVIDSTVAGPIDVSADCSSGSLTLRENGSHNLSIRIENPNRKYDGIFTPNDRIVVQMKRLRWVQVFAGYLDSAPYYSTFARPIELTAQCTLKVLRYWPWDRGSAKARALLSSARDRMSQDGGMSEIIVRLLTEVTNWHEDRIHIGRVPEEWYAKFERIYQRLDDEIKAEYDPLVGVNPIIAGKPVGGLSGVSSASFAVTGAGVSGAASQFEAITVADGDIEIVLQTIRTMESGGDYRAINKGDGKGDWATGAYQFTDGTWNNYGGYKRAYEAPPVIQDERARADVRGFLSRYGNRAMNVPLGWYYPVSLKDPSWLDKVPAANEGNKLTIRQYAEKWLRAYVEIYSKERGGPPPSFSGTAPVSGTQPTSGGVLYPIPPGVTRLLSSESGWGGYQNGQVPSTAMAYDRRTGQGHPIAVKSWIELHTAAAAAGFDLQGSMYRSRDAQAKVGSMGAPPGKSNHGWGLAIDISVLVPNATYNKRYPSFNNTEMYSTPEYQWLKANAYKFGWGHPDWAQQGGSKPEAWHWEFFAFKNYQGANVPATSGGVNPFDNALGGIGGISTAPLDAKTLFSAVAAWAGPPEEDSGFETGLFGYKALMNDEPILVALKQFIGAAGRSYCAAPNGDFISWWPDYWGEYGIAGAVDVEAIELKDFTVNWSDESLITHQYVEGAYFLNDVGPTPSGILDGYQAVQTRGVATIDMPNFLASIINVKDASQYPWLQDPQLLLQRFGARIDRSKNPQIYGPHQEFFDAVARFTRAWAAQFSASAPMTFMPELFPGMLMRLPLFKVQMYVTSVTHSWDYNSGSGFTTTASTMAISALDGSGFFLFPKGGDLRPSAGRSGGGRMLYR